MKKLDKLIIKAFIGPFVATFFITLFVLIMQFFWLWIDDFVGKGLDAGTIMKFIWYQSAVLIPLALPLSVLLSSLMTFGNLGESFELVAIKSAGISLMRFMRPLFVVATCIALGAFLFSNYVIPVANLKSRTLLADIVLAKPAFAIKEGVFFDGIDKFAIKIGKKEANDSIIRDVIVYQAGDNSLQDAFLIASDGVMKPSPDKRFLDIVFKNGWRYEERGSKEDSTTDYIRLGFKEYKMQMDISSFKFTKTDDSANVNNERMYNMRQLNVAIDSISKFNGEIAKNFEATIYANFMILNYRDSITKDIKIPDSILNFKANIDAYMGVKKDSTKAEKDSARARAKLDSTRQRLKADSLKRVARKDSIRFKRTADSTRRKARRDSIKMGLKPLAPPPPQRSGNRDSVKNKRSDIAARTVASAKDTTKNKKDTSAAKKDSVAKAAAKVKPVKKDPNSFTALLPDSARQQIQDRALTSLESFRNNLEMNGNNIVEQEKTLQKYKIEWHKKIALALACIVLFMIGAPLGSIIRKGGLGTPMIFAIIFFMVFYFVSTRGEKLAKEMEMSAFSGMWLSTFVLVPVGIFLIYKAMHDSNLFNKEFYTRLKRKVLKKLGKES
ncbi:LptF/LptG family permease [Niabella sp. CJ426]|uniref:LptF/LptG family permease n=1 Tax=Niabella sp. CJ426 TaxID=3393740 RepID=UPI003D024EEE